MWKKLLYLDKNNQELPLVTAIVFMVESGHFLLDSIWFGL